MIFTVRQLQEKCQDKDLYQCIIDLTKAFNTVNSEAVWKIVSKLACPEIFVGLIRTIPDDMKAWICAGVELLDPNSAEAEMKQGDLVAPNFLRSSLLWSF